MNQYPPGNYLGLAMSKLPAPGADVPPQTIVLDAGPLWGSYRITFVAKRNPRQGMRNFWFWTMQSGAKLE